MIGQAPKYIAAELFDKIAAKALELGGVGSGFWRITPDLKDGLMRTYVFDSNVLAAVPTSVKTEVKPDSCAFCINGIYDEVKCQPTARSYGYEEGMPGISDNDEVVSAWIESKGLPAYSRMPWAEYVEAMNLVRVVQGCDNLKEEK